MCISLPIFHRAANADKVTGKIVDIETLSQTYRGRNYDSFSPVVEYDYEGQHYRRELSLSSPKRPELGNEINLRVYKKNPTKIVTAKEVVFSAFMTVIFSAMAVAFSIPGILTLTGNGNLINWDTSEPVESGIEWPALLIGFGFAFVFTLIGVIICLVIKKENGKERLKETGIKKEYLITDISINTNIEINGEYPVVLTCHRDGKALTLKTKTFFRKFKFHKGDKIDIYFDPNNEKKFVADFGDD